jgi:hypothetical protein
VADRTPCGTNQMCLTGSCIACTQSGQSCNVDTNCHLCCLGASCVINRPGIPCTCN